MCLLASSSDYIHETIYQYRARAAVGMVNFYDIVIKSPGGPEVLSQSKRPRPKRDHHEGLITTSLGVNCPDVIQRSRAYLPHPTCQGWMLDYSDHKPILL